MRWRSQPERRRSRRAPALLLVVLLGARAWFAAPPALAQATAAPFPPGLTAGLAGGIMARSGTGFFVTADGLLLTAHHVLGESEQAFVKLDGERRPRPAKVVRRDERQDLALLQVVVDAPVPHLRLARWDEVPMGLEAYVLGFPLPGVQGTTIKITTGLINGLAGRSGQARLFQLSAEVQRGNSGGPVLSPDGLVTGMVFSKLNALQVQEKERDLPQNVNYALNAAALADFLNGVAEPPVRPELGLQQRAFEILRSARAAVALVLVLPSGRSNRPAPAAAEHGGSP